MFEFDIAFAYYVERGWMWVTVDWLGGVTMFTRLSFLGTDVDFRTLMYSGPPL